MASAIESLVFFAVANFKGGRYIGIGIMFDASAIVISPHTKARDNSFIGINVQ